MPIAPPLAPILAGAVLPPATAPATPFKGSARVKLFLETLAAAITALCGEPVVFAGLIPPKAR